MAFTPNQVGPVQLVSKSSTRGRLFAGGTFFRSIGQGELMNLLRVGAVTDGIEGVLVVMNMQLSPEAQITAIGISNPIIELYKLNLAWNQELVIQYANGAWGASILGIRWQIASGPAPFPPIVLGPVKEGVFNAGGMTFKITGLMNWPTTAVIYLRPRTQQYHLAALSATDPITAVVSTGWDIGALRATMNAAPLCWIRMPVRGTPADPGPPPVPGSPGEDVQDAGVDDSVLSVFDMTSLSGGSGLPLTPAGINTGPRKALVQLNYTEQSDGSMAALNQVFEWVGDSATVGAWQRYS